MPIRKQLPMPHSGISPSLLLVAFSIITFQGVLLITAILVLRPDLTLTTFLALIGVCVAFFATFPLYSGLYVPIAEGTRGFTQTMMTLIQGIREYYRPLLIADCYAGVIAIGSAVVITFLASTSLTLGHSLAIIGESSATEPVEIAGLYLPTRPLQIFGIALLISISVVRYTPGFVIIKGEAPRTAWLSSVRLVRYNLIHKYVHGSVFVFLTVVWAIFLLFGSTGWILAVYEFSIGEFHPGSIRYSLMHLAAVVLLPVMAALQVRSIKSVSDISPPASRIIDRRLVLDSMVLLLFAIPIVIFQGVLVFIASLILSSDLSVVPMIIGFAGVVVLFIGTVPLYAGIYLPISRGTRGIENTVSVAQLGIRDNYRSQFLASVIATPVALAGGLVASILWFILATGHRYLSLLTTETVPIHAQIDAVSPEIGMLFAFAGGVLISISVVRYAQGLVIFHAVPPTRGWLASIRFVRSRPKGSVFHGLFFVVLTGLWAYFLLHNSARLIPALGLHSTSNTTLSVIDSLVGILMAGGALVTGTALHVHAIGATSLSDLPSTVDRAPSLDKRRLAVVCVVLVVTVTGASYVRVADLGTGEQPIQPLPDDPDRAVQVALENTRDANHRQVYLVRNESRPNSSFEVYRTATVDYDDREMFYFHQDLERPTDGTYYSEVVFGTSRSSPGTGTNSSDLLTREWRSYHPVRFGDFATPIRDTEQHYLGFPRHEYSRAIEFSRFHMLEFYDWDWRVVSHNESTIRYRFGGDFGILTTHDYGRFIDIDEKNHTTMVVDRDRGVVRQITFFAGQRNDIYSETYRIRFEDVGSIDVQRPPGVRLSTPSELFWDLAYY